MNLQMGLLLVTVFFGWSDVVQGNPYAADWWSKGVGTVRNFVFGAGPSPWHQEPEWRIEFDPEAGPRKASEYQRHFGPRGERLIELLGSGAYRTGNSQMYSHLSNPSMNPRY